MKNGKWKMTNHPYFATQAGGEKRHYDRLFLFCVDDEALLEVEPLCFSFKQSYLTKNF